jgi:hypothetical protein
MFSIAELSFASWSERVFIRIAWFGMLAEIPFNSARYRCADAVFLRIALVSKSISGGRNLGIVLIH